MARIKAYLDPIGNTLNLWWGRKKDAYESIEAENPNRNDVIIVDKKGRPVSLEIIGFLPKELDPVQYLSPKEIMFYLDTGKAQPFLPKLKS